VRLQRAARGARLGPERQAAQIERVRKMLLTFARDLRVVLLRLASRLQTLRYHAATRRPCPPELAIESQRVFAPLANRLGIWQIKWELEDLAFRFLQPAAYHEVARLLDATRAERERAVEAARRQLQQRLADAGLRAEVHGRPKHLYSIWKKMQGKGLDFDHVYDLRALRVIVEDVPACYAALARVHERYVPVEGEFDDYIAKPKANGYQSLHTVVRGDDGRPLEVQIRTRQMHEHAEHGVAAHWMYKEAGARGYAGVSASGEFEQRLADARKAVLRELLAWERDAVGGAGERAATGALPGAVGADVFDERVYAFTPQATIIDLPAGGTPVDFAYAVHTDLGHRCRGAKVDGVMVPLNSPLESGQTVEILAVKEGGPSLDWLNPELGYLRSPRARAKVRAWFNAEQQAATIARGRDAVERLLQREGRTAVKLETLAAQLGFDDANALFEVVGKDEYSLRHIEQLLRPPPAPASAETVVPLHRPRAVRGEDPRGGVLVVGVDSLMTTLSRCCRPVPPDAIAGFVTRGKGVAIHRVDCSNFRHLAERQRERVVDVEWGVAADARRAVYPLDLQVEADERPGLLRDVVEALAKERVNVTAARPLRLRGRGALRLALSAEVDDAARLAQGLERVRRVPGVHDARRR
jgi:GTP pyrophosphokinase